MAKTRAQRKAERRAREAREARQRGRDGSDGEGRAQHQTQVPESGEVAEAEAVLETGAPPEELGESVRSSTDVAEPEPAEREERRRGAVLSFLISCWAELKRVQWPDRETLIQASAVTLLFIAVAAAYLGALDAFFNWIVKLIL